MSANNFHTGTGSSLLNPTFNTIKTDGNLPSSAASISVGPNLFTYTGGNAAICCRDNVGLFAGATSIDTAGNIGGTYCSLTVPGSSSQGNVKIAGAGLDVAGAINVGAVNVGILQLYNNLMYINTVTNNCMQIVNNTQYSGGFIFYTNTTGGYFQIRADTTTATGSDIRIKENIKSIDQRSALENIRNVIPTNYNYKLSDTLSTGFIAQNVDMFIPDAISKFPKHIANVSCKAYIECICLDENKYKFILIGNRIEDIEELALQNKIEFYYVGGNNDSLEGVLVGLDVDNNSLIMILKTGDYNSNYDTVYVHGTVVEDFHSLTINTVFVHAVAALQQVDKELQTSKSDLEEMKSKYDELRKEIDSIKIKLQMND